MGEIKSVNAADEDKVWIPHKITAIPTKIFRGSRPVGVVEITLSNSNATVIPKVGEKYYYSLRKLQSDFFEVGDP